MPVASNRSRTAPGAPDISVVVMAFNEAETLLPVVEDIDRALIEMNRSYEIVIVDDGSGDGTDIVADQLAANHANVRVIHHEVNRGLGEVYRTGFAGARGTMITFFPADGQFLPSTIKQFVTLMDDADMVLGYLPDRKRSLLAKGLSFAERVLYTCLFGKLPRFQGVLMFRRELLTKIELASTGRGWTVLMELIIRVARSGYRVVGVATELRPRMSGK